MQQLRVLNGQALECTGSGKNHDKGVYLYYTGHQCSCESVDGLSAIWALDRFPSLYIK